MDDYVRHIIANLPEDWGDGKQSRWWISSSNEEVETLGSDAIAISWELYLLLGSPNKDFMNQKAPALNLNNRAPDVLFTISFVSAAIILNLAPEHVHPGRWAEEIRRKTSASEMDNYIFQAMGHPKKSIGGSE